MREKLARFMAGRNGSDQLTRFISIVVCAALVLSLFMDTDAQLAIWLSPSSRPIYVYFRVFSRNVARRRQENRGFPQRHRLRPRVFPWAARALDPAAGLQVLPLPLMPHDCCACRAARQDTHRLPQVRHVIHKEHLRCFGYVIR